LNLESTRLRINVSFLKPLIVPFNKFIIYTNSFFVDLSSRVRK